MGMYRGVNNSKGKYHDGTNSKGMYRGVTNSVVTGTGEVIEKKPGHTTEETHGDEDNYH
jgi:hypothetical protein